MAEDFNLRLLSAATAADLAREIARIEPYPERIAATASKGTFLLIHAAGLGPTAAMILKQELLALDADCVISPTAYLGEADTPTDVLIMGTLRQLRALVPRLRPLPVGRLPELAEQLEMLLARSATPPPAMPLRGSRLCWGERTYVMGIVNVTPDSFSGDGLLRHGAEAVGTAVEQGRRFVEDGADLLDIGGESTRPGAAPVDAAEEAGRVIPVIVALRARLDTPISVDTFKAEVAAAALDAGADLVNDVWGLRRPEGGWNEALARLIAARDVPVVIMHNRRAVAASGSVGGHYQAVQYDDLLADVIRELRASIGFAEECGIRRERIIVDPGVGFGKTPDQNVELLRGLGQLRSLGLPILLGTSRKSFIGRVLNLPPDERVEGTAATVALGIGAGADIVRVHDVAAMVRVARMSDVLTRPGASLNPSR